MSFSFLNFFFRGAAIGATALLGAYMYHKKQKNSSGFPCRVPGYISPIEKLMPIEKVLGVLESS